MNVCFCPSCRSLILADFRYCPYCGARAGKGPDLEEALSGPFEKLDGDLGIERSDAANAPVDVFAGLKESLDRLEADMDLILEELEKEGH